MRVKAGKGEHTMVEKRGEKGDHSESREEEGEAWEDREGKCQQVLTKVSVIACQPGRCQCPFIPLVEMYNQ